jgi:hypothetical protein
LVDSNIPGTAPETLFEFGRVDQIAAARSLLFAANAI